MILFPVSVSLDTCFHLLGSSSSLSNASSHRSLSRPFDLAARIALLGSFLTVFLSDHVACPLQSLRPYMLGQAQLFIVTIQLSIVSHSPGIGFFNWNKYRGVGWVRARLGLQHKFSMFQLSANIRQSKVRLAQ